jgi:hypothetical protein
MKSTEFRKIALELPDTLEQSHMNHPDFRVSGKIFATLSADESYGFLLLAPDQQKDFININPGAFTPAPGKWGASGCTKVQLNSVKKSQLQDAIAKAWFNKALKKKMDKINVKTKKRDA